MNCKSLSVLLGVSALAGIALAAEVDLNKLPPAASREGVTFAKDIKPIFDKSCIKCHGPERPKARLRLDSLEATLKGSENGKVVEPGNSAKSILLHAVAHLLPKDEWMPPPNNRVNASPLTPEEIGLIRAWIEQGAR
ncbi:MAG TPA: hypothetical protein GYA07_16600 [Verrucomicrobia bacterium]|nr:hypothetical protein [Verrucomicrobiota bacterium]HOB31497.1 hypothetical protein [Verrucomicrobiota bacterium]HOP98072.1 hypothetical protein [Verrucomicrobiota bacterium]HPU56398.1 hypothetical protein [Verrucomicrobiota bacterium]